MFVDKSEVIELVRKEFTSVVDKAGAPYVEHLYAVATEAARIAMSSRFYADVDEVFVVGLLHDLVEDIDGWTVEKVALKYGVAIASSVDNLTKRVSESRDDYLARVALNHVSLIVKIADARHNSDVSRFENPTPSEIAKCAEYAKLAEYLESLL